MRTYKKIKLLDGTKVPDFEKILKKPEVTIKINCELNRHNIHEICDWIFQQQSWLYRNWGNCSKNMVFRKFGVKSPDKDKLNCAKKMKKILETPPFANSLNCACKRPLYKNDRENCQRCVCPIDRTRKSSEK